MGSPFWQVLRPYTRYLKLMREDSNPHLWINDLTLDQARQHLEDRGLSLQGIVPVLRARLLRYELAVRRGSPIPVSTPDPVEDVAMSLPSGVTPSKTTPQKDDRSTRPLPVPPFAMGEEKGEDTMGMTDDSRPYLRPRAFPPPVEHRTSRASTAEAYNLMRKWNLHFSGKRGSDAEAFLLRIKEARAIVPITDSDLFKCLPLFLSDMALYWVRLESENWRDWNDFEAAWRARFGDPDYQYALRDEIFRRTQGEFESAVDYLTCLRALFSRMSPPWPLAEQLNFAHRNMLPRLQIAIRRTEFTDFSTLEYLATRVERSFLAEKNYRPPLPPEQSIFPDLAYHAPKGKSKNPATVATIASTKRGKTKQNKAAKANPRNSARDTAADPVAAPKPSATNAAVTAVATTSNALKCWNCEAVGHRARECTEPRKVYCYRCGKRDFTVKTCPTCTGNADRSQ